MAYQTVQANHLISSTSTLELLLAYKYPPLIARLRRKEEMSEAEAKEAFTDTLMFLYLCGSSEKNFVPTEKIDVVWHHFILFTSAYADFCNTFFGRFIHHIPAEARISDTSSQADLSNWSACKSCVSCEGGSSGHSIEPFSNPSLEQTLVAARNRFGKLSPNWR